MEPRRQHYQFAHRILPGWFFNDPTKFAETCDEDGMLFIHWLWGKAGEGLEDSDLVADSGLAFEKVVKNGTAGIVVTLPEPIGMTEAYFVVLVITKKGKPRVFTLEHSFDLDENPLTISCEWTEDHTHINKGTFAGVGKDAFIDYVFTSLIAN